MPRSTTLLAAAFFLLATGACREPLRVPAKAAATPAPVRPGTLEPCDLAPLAEVQHVLGGLAVQPAQAAIDSPSPEFARCVYAYGEANPTLVVSLELRRQESPERGAALFAASLDFLSRLARRPVEAIPGLGEGAVWAGGSVSQLHAHAGRFLMIVTVDAGEPDFRRRAAIGIAGRALARLAGTSIPPDYELDWKSQLAPVAPPPHAE